MGMKPMQFFESFVKGNNDDCHENPGCVRRAFNASVAASHLADHYFTYNKNHEPALVSKFAALGNYVDHLSRQTGGAFRDIRSIANAYKHLYTDIDPKKITYNSVSSPAAIESIEIHGDGLEINSISAEYATKSGVQESRSFVSFTRKDGSKSEFLPILDAVVDYWRGEIYKSA